MESYKLGFSLSGGGARGFAHLGILQALYEYEIYPDAIAGVSAGAIVGVFIASGMNPKQVFDLLKDHGLFEYSRIRLPKDGLLSLEGLKKLIEEECPVRRVEDLQTKMWIVATNLNKGHVEYFDEGDIHELVMASSSIPVIFAPIKINNYSYVDGGVMDNLPVKPLLASCEKVVGININPLNEENKLDHLIQIASRVFHLSVNANALANKRKCDVVIEPESLSRFDLLDSSKADELYKAGYEYTLEYLNRRRMKKGQII